MNFPILIKQGTPRHRTVKWGGWAFWFLVIFLVGFAYVDTGTLDVGSNSYNLSLIRLNKAIAFMVAILGLQVIVGFTGQIALGQGFFVGTGAYLTAYLVADQDWGYFTTLLVVVPFCFVIGMILGLPALRIKGLYLGLVTLAMATVFPAIVQLDVLSDYTNGAGGKSVDSKLVAPEWLPLDGIAGFLQSFPLVGQYFGDGDLSSRESDRLWKYLLLVIVAFICFWLVSNLLKSRPGRAIRAIRDNETGAAVSGVNLQRDKTLAFGVSSALGGVGGTLYVTELGIASPGDFTQLLSILFIVGLVVGGVGTLSGAVIGGIVITFVPDWASSTQSVLFLPEDVSERLGQGPTGSLILGLALIVLTFFLPGGVSRGVLIARARYFRFVPAPPIPPSGGGSSTPPVAEAEAADEVAEELADAEPDAVPGG